MDEREIDIIFDIVSTGFIVLILFLATPIDQIRKFYSDVDIFEFFTITLFINIASNRFKRIIKPMIIKEKESESNNGKRD